MVDHPGQFIIKWLCPKSPQDLSAPAPATWAGSVGRHRVPATWAHAPPPKASEITNDQEARYFGLFWNKDQPLNDYHRAADHSDETPEVEKDADAGSSRKRKWETWNRLIILCEHRI